jgi:hypothetical protein
MKMGKTHAKQLKKVRQAQKEKEIERCWELWERYRNKLYRMEAIHNKRREG